jgi:hypothetical protein
MLRVVYPKLTELCICEPQQRKLRHRNRARNQMMSIKHLHAERSYSAIGHARVNKVLGRKAELSRRHKPSRIAA